MKNRIRFLSSIRFGRTENVLPRKQLEIVLIAFDASYVHIYGPGTRRHINNAF